jgi:hypothetical protein
MRAVITLALLLITVAWGATGCSSNPASPTASNDTTGQGGGGGGGNLGRYGTQYFQSSANTRWNVTFPAQVINGVILAENESAVSQTGTVIYDGRIDVGSSRTVSFLWKGGLTGGATVNFSASTDGVSWTESSHHSDGDWEVAEYTFLLDFVDPLTMKFELVVPVSARVRITEVRAYGR